MRSTPALLVVFLIVLHRWLELVTGWPEAATFPLVGLVGTFLIDRLALPAHARLDLRAWGFNLAALAAVGVLVAVLAR